ncbi:MAG: DUF4926 domain-containing protein [Phormidesmis sp. CAN_BIN44]|nr:DUF4926 domain-containing protein [Phormidesmis sp. CAN_BIN44]
MTLEPYSLVKLLTDRYQDRGVVAGAIGTILEVYEDEAYEVEFSRDDGTTIAWFAVLQTEVKPLTDENLVSIPSQKESA